VPLLGCAHVALLIGIAGVAILLSALCWRDRGSPGRFSRPVRLALGFGLAGNELIWWVFRYSHEGVHLANLPLQLCDLTVWSAVWACLKPAPIVVEFTYFAGLAGAGIALLTPDLWSPWPSYPAIYFFVAHGGVVVAASVLVFGGAAPLSRCTPWRSFSLLLAYAAAAGALNAVLGANYMYLCRKPKSPSLLNVLGPWPMYLVSGAAAALGIFWLLWLPLRSTMRMPPQHAVGGSGPVPPSRSR
jgi:hypothetical integral membrane protein (TIGR02206 family)